MNKNIIIADLIFKYLKGELSSDEKQIFDVWLENADNQEYLRHLQETDILYSDIAAMWKTDTRKKKEAFAEIEAAARRRHRFSVFRYTAGVAAFVALVIGGYWGVLNRQETEPLVATRQTPVIFDRESAVLETAKGDIYYITDSVEHGGIVRKNPYSASKKLNTLTTFRQKLTSVTLDDGTHVWLNTDSRLEYPDRFVKKERVVHLSGEAFFEVARNTGKPFVVRTQNADICVLGTTFNINTTGNYSVTTLVEGSVQIKNGREDRVTLLPGQQATLNSKDDISVRRVDVNYYIAWRKSLFAFENQPLLNIITAIALWYSMDYEFEDDTFRQVRYTSIIRKYDDVAETLTILNEMNEFSAYVVGNTIKISKK